MAFQINIPKLGMTMSEAKLVEWKVKEGERIEKGSIVLAIETEKIAWEVEAVASGFLHIVAKEGDVALVGAIVGLIAETMEELEKLQREHPSVEVVERKTISASGSALAASEMLQKKEFVTASPLARRLARELGLELPMVPGTGPGGRIVEADVIKFHKENVRDTQEPKRQKGETKPVRSIHFTGMRKTIAENLHSSLLNTAQMTVFTEVDVTDMVRFRDLLREEYKNDEAIEVSYNDIAILATSRVLKQFPIMNSTLVGDEILLHDTVNMGIAVALPDGLIVPVLRNADRKGLLQIASGARELSRKAREKKLTVDEVTGGTFTISNVGMFDTGGATLILRPPETGILGIHRVKEKPAVHKGEIVIRSMMFLSLTFDHRVVDGAPANAFLETVARFLQNPTLIMT